MCPRQPLARLASWAIVVACPTGSHWILASQPLHGLYQSTFRAELSAVAYVLQVAAGSTKPFKIWADCLGVVRKVRTLQTVAHPPNAMASNGDRWLLVWMSIQLLDVSFDICHVPSYEDPLYHDNPVAEWLVKQNHAADRAATAASAVSKHIKVSQIQGLVRGRLQAG